VVRLLWCSCWALPIWWIGGYRRRRMRRCHWCNSLWVQRDLVSSTS
jgi:hypothetical protein